MNISRVQFSLILATLVMASNPVFSMDRSETCCICLEEMKEADAKKTLTRCEHSFHTDCIDRWLGEKNNCPLCRTKISDKDKPKAARARQEEIAGRREEEEENREALSNLAIAQSIFSGARYPAIAQVIVSSSLILVATTNYVPNADIPDTIRQRITSIL